MTRKPVDSPYLKALESRVLIYDGAMGTSIQRFNLTPDDFGGKSLEGCNDNLVITGRCIQRSTNLPRVVCDVVEHAPSVGSPPAEEWGLGDRSSRSTAADM